MDEIATASPDAPTRELLTSAVGDRCASCQAPLASDQRYCVNCGERRGKPRFSFQSLAGQSAPAPAPPANRRPRISSSSTLVAGVATLLLAMGVGVLIGQNGTSNTKAPPQAQVITVNGGGGASTTAGTASSAATNAGTGASATHFKAKKVKVTTKIVQQAAAAASKVTGGQGPSNPTVSVGQPASGPGTQNGHFTGQFFGQ